MLRQNIEVTQDKKLVNPAIHVVQGDTGRTVVALVKDATISGTATMAFERPDGATYTTTATVNSDNSVEATFTADMLRVAGTGKATFKVVSSGSQVSTYQLYVLVEPSAGFERPITPSNNKIYVYVNGSPVEVATAAEVASKASQSQVDGISAAVNNLVDRIVEDEDNIAINTATLRNKMNKVRIDFDGTNFKIGTHTLNYKELYDIHISNPDFGFVVYGDRAYLLSYVQDGAGMKEMRFQSTIATTDSSNLSYTKTSGIYVTSSDGINIASARVADINSENKAYKATEFTEANKNSDTWYPSNKAVNNVVSELKDDLTDTKNRLSDSITEINNKVIIKKQYVERELYISDKLYNYTTEMKELSLNGYHIYPPIDVLKGHYYIDTFFAAQSYAVDKYTNAVTKMSDLIGSGNEYTGEFDLPFDAKLYLSYTNVSSKKDMLVNDYKLPNSYEEGVYSILIEGHEQMFSIAEWESGTIGDGVEADSSTRIRTKFIKLFANCVYRFDAKNSKFRNVFLYDDNKTYVGDYKLFDLERNEDYVEISSSLNGYMRIVASNANTSKTADVNILHPFVYPVSVGSVLFQYLKDTEQIVTKQCYISDGGLVGNISSHNIATYAGIDLGKTPTKISVKGVFRSGQNEEHAVLISNPLGLTRSGDITNKSLHAVFKSNAVTVGLYNAQTLTPIYTETYSNTLQSNVEYEFSVELDGDTLKVRTATGLHEVDVSSYNVSSYMGRYCTIEHYGTTKKSFKFTELKVFDGNKCIAYDNFNRKDGYPCNTLSGQPYVLMSAEEAWGYYTP